MIDLTGYKLTFDEEFNERSISLTGAGTTWADTRSEWRFDESSDIGFGRSSFVDPSSGYDPFSVSAGALSITAVPDRTSSGFPGSWESGLITTEGNFSQQYGYFEMRADLSDAVGAWDAFWMLPDQGTPDPNNLGQWQELDVVEHYGEWDQGVYSHIHTTDKEPNENWQANLQVYSELDNPDGYHTYGVDWQEDRLSFYVDGELVGSQATPSDMHSPMHLLANLATQEPADAANVPMTANIDYIRAYSADPSAQAVAQDQISSPDGFDPGLYGAETATQAATPTQPEPAPSTPVGSGPDELALEISQDAYEGDALYTVSVDGIQVGGTRTASASHAAGESDVVTVEGDWGPGEHTVLVDFLNDVWHGTPDTDRNLYLDAATYNGESPLEGEFGTVYGQNFSFHDYD